MVKQLNDQVNVSDSSWYQCLKAHIQEKGQNRTDSCFNAPFSPLQVGLIKDFKTKTLWIFFLDVDSHTWKDNVIFHWNQG